MNRLILPAFAGKLDPPYMAGAQKRIRVLMIFFVIIQLDRAMRRYLWLYLWRLICLNPCFRRFARVLLNSQQRCDWLQPWSGVRNGSCITGKGCGNRWPHPGGLYLLAGPLWCLPVSVHGRRNKGRPAQCWLMALLPMLLHLSAFLRAASQNYKTGVGSDQVNCLIELIISKKERLILSLEHYF